MSKVGGQDGARCLILAAESRAISRAARARRAPQRLDVRLRSRFSLACCSVISGGPFPPAVLWCSLPLFRLYMVGLRARHITSSEVSDIAFSGIVQNSILALGIWEREHYRRLVLGA